MIIQTETTDKSLSALGGLVVAKKALGHLDLETKLAGLLPAQQSARRTTSYGKFNALLFGFIAGAQCLDDVERLGADPAFLAAIGGKVNAAQTYGDFLRGFDEKSCRELNDALIDTAMALRAASRGNVKELVVDIDSTSHIQHGEKMEGLAYNYKNDWCLDSIEAFDQFGFQLWSNVRPGNTATHVGAPEIIGAIFRKAPPVRSMKRFVRADSGYCNWDVFNACADADAKFTITMRANMFGPLLADIDNWKRSKVKFYDGRDAEMGQTLYRSAIGRQVLRVVVIRALKADAGARIMNVDRYDHYAWVTNIGEHELSGEKVIAFYRGRGNAENFIRELKNGFDLRHFPCQSLLANKAYGLIAAFAHNLMRFLAFIENPKKSHFSKLIRWKMIGLPVQVVKHARQVIFRFMEHHHQEVRNWFMRINIMFTASLQATDGRPRLLTTS
ncbi:MAG: IS1380 family transposase [Silvanigrellales bacterium]|nr:IS1380 family transposase [Silvanigrellales bacterium]